MARRVALNLSESKRLSVINQVVFPAPSATLARRWVFRPVFSALPVATDVAAGSSYALVGNEVVDLMTKAKFVFRLDYNTIVGGLNHTLTYGTYFFHVYLVASNDLAAPGNLILPGSTTWYQYPEPYTTSDYGWFLNPDGHKPTLNGNNCRVVRKWTKKFTPDVQYAYQNAAEDTRLGLGQIIMNLNVKHRFKGKRTYEDDPSGGGEPNFNRTGSLRGTNYFWLCGWQAPSDLGAGSQPRVYMDEFLYFKDP